MTGSNYEPALEKRVERLERENRRLKRVGLLLLAFAVSIILMGQARPATVIEAERFVIVNAEGAKKGELGVGRGGRPHLWLFDRNDDLGVILGIGSDETGAGALLALGNSVGAEPESRLLIRAYDDNKRPFIQAKNEFKQVIWSMP